MSLTLYLSFLIFLLFILFAILYRLIYTNLLQPGAIYFPTPDTTVKKMLNLAKVSKNDTILDLGSGDGRFLIAAGKLGAKAVGYEIDPLLARRSKKAISKANLSHLATVKCKSFWQADFNQASIITLYLFPNLMNRLQKKLEKNLTHPITLVSHNYQFPQKKYIKKQGNLYLYQFKPKK